MTLATDLATRIHRIRYADLSPEAVRAAKVGILDLVGVTLAGCAEPTARIVAGVLTADSGEAAIFGTQRRASMLDAVAAMDRSSSAA